MSRDSALFVVAAVAIAAFLFLPGLLKGALTLVFVGVIVLLALMFLRRI